MRCEGSRVLSSLPRGGAPAAAERRERDGRRGDQQVELVAAGAVEEALRPVDERDRNRHRRDDREGCKGYEGAERRRHYEVLAVMVIPPRAFWTSVTWTRPASSSRAAATSSRIWTARASAKTPSLRKLAR